MRAQDEHPHDARRGKTGPVFPAPPQASIKQRFRARMHNDFTLAIITLFGISSILIILPFAIFRLLTGNLTVAALDFSLVLGITAPVLYAWRTGKTAAAGITMVLFYSSGAVLSAMLLGVIGLFWIYPTILANFYLAGRRAASVITTLCVLSLAAHGDSFKDQIEILSFLATTLLVSTLAYVLANRTEAQRHALEQLAARDPLTGVANRRVMTEELAIATAAHAREPSSIALVMLDIDYFKRVNDEHGHSEGDRVLIALSQLVAHATRPTDRFFRYGGEEFVLLLPGCAAAELAIVAEKLRMEVSATLRTPSGAVTISLGATLLREGEDWQAWLRRADAALYRAKAAGRNRAVLDMQAAPTQAATVKQHRSDAPLPLI
jgi:diguanylate cyclase